MKKFLFILVISTVSIFIARAGGVEAFIANCTFFAPNSGPYVESYISIPAHTLNFQETNSSNYCASVEVVLLYKQGDDIKAFEKYILKSVETEKENPSDFSLIDQKRVSLPNGVYTLEATFKDLSNPEYVQNVTEPIIIDFSDTKVTLSDVELVESIEKSIEETPYTKSGLELVPYAFNFYPDHLTHIKYYTEVYNTKQLVEGPGFLVTCAVHKKDKQVVFGDFNRFKKYSPDEVVPVVGEFDLSTLPSGNFDLVIEVKDAKNNLLARKVKFFQRLNTTKFNDVSEYTKVSIVSSFVERMTKDEVIYHLNSIFPVANNDERRYINNIVKDKETLRMKQFFLNFWATRNPLQPEAEWLTYREKVKAVVDNYSTAIQPGFETPRGRVYLQYGSPNDIQLGREPGTKPYEIWTYYNLPTGQTRGKFVFANLTLMPQDYEMLHSTVQGEIQDSRWQLRISESFKNQSNGLDFDQQNMRDHFGSHADDYFNE